MVLILVGSSWDVEDLSIISYLDVDVRGFQKALIDLNGLKELTRVSSLGDVVSGKGLVKLLAPNIVHVFATASYAFLDLFIGFGSIIDRRSLIATVAVRQPINDKNLISAFAKKMIEVYGVSIARVASHLAHKCSSAGVVALEHVRGRAAKPRIRVFYGSRGRVCIMYRERMVVVGSGVNCYDSVLVEVRLGRVSRIMVYDLSKALREL